MSFLQRRQKSKKCHTHPRSHTRTDTYTSRPDTRKPEPGAQHGVAIFDKETVKPTNSSRFNRLEEIQNCRTAPVFQYACHPTENKAFAKSSRFAHVGWRHRKTRAIPRLAAGDRTIERDRRISGFRIFRRDRRAEKKGHWIPRSSDRSREDRAARLEPAARRSSRCLQRFCTRTRSSTNLKNGCGNSPPHTALSPAPHGKTTMAPRLFMMQPQQARGELTLATAHQTQVAPMRTAFAACSWPISSSASRIWR